MNRYYFIRRLTGPAILLLLGIVALLSEMHLAHFSIFVPLLLILLGILKLAERAAWAEYPGAQPPGAHPCGGVIDGPGYSAGPDYSANSGPANSGRSSSPASSGSLAPRFQELGAGSGLGREETGEGTR